jgi:hypothetical protein
VMVKFDCSAHPKPHGAPAAPPSKLLFLFSQLSLSSTKILRIKVIHVDKVISLHTVPRFLCVTRDLWDGKLGTLSKGATAGPPPSARRRGWRSPKQVVARKRCRAASQPARPPQPERIMHSGIFCPIEEHLKILSLPSRVWTSSHTSRWQ